MDPWIIALLCVAATVVVLLVVYLIVKVKVANREITQAPAVTKKASEVVEKVEEKVAEEVAVPEEDEELAVSDAQEGIDVAKRVAFAEKLLGLEEKVHGYFDTIYNKFISLRKINPRISTKGVSFRYGRKLVARLTIRGKTMRLHLALDCNAYDKKIYFQTDMGDVKSYVEIPMMVKVRSDRGFKNAMKLIDALIEKEAIEAKTRYNAVDALAALKETIA